MSHEAIEKNTALLGVLIAVVISVAGIAEIVPLYFSRAATEAAPGIKPLGALQLEGRDIYVREGCYVCHSQMIRPLRAETERFGRFSLAGEFVYDRPFQFGSKRTGPDLARVGGRYTDEWHLMHLRNPRDLVPESNMPAYKWLEGRPLDSKRTADKLRGHRMLGTPYTDADIAGAAEAVAGKDEMQALIAYLQGLGTASSQWQ